MNVESSFMASHPLNDSDRRMFCQLVEHYTKDVAQPSALPRPYYPNATFLLRRKK